MEHFLDRSTTRNRWNRDYPPRLTIAPGDTLTMELKDASDGQVQPHLSASDFSQIDTTRIHALTGPVAIDGAQPGDHLEIEILDLQHEGWAWTSIIPGLGLLPEHFPQHFLHIWKLEGQQTRSMPGVTLDLAPFCGIIGVTPDQNGEHRTRPPGVFGGNMDVRHLTAGARLFLPVFLPGALLCAGDAHAAQGDGEVCINGMEAPMRVTLRIHLRKAPLKAPYAITPSPLLPPRYLQKPFHMFIETAEDPRAACREVVLRAIDYLQTRIGLSAEQAYVLCSVVLDLKISQLVNTPTTTITGYLPEAIFNV